MLKLDSTALIENVETSSKELEIILLGYMQKKLDGTLEDQYDFNDYEHVQQSLDKLKDIQADSYTTTRDSKQATSDAKDNLDKRQVEMQDVMYEKRHILEEIVKCREFRSVYQDVELIPFEEFQEKAGPEYLVDMDDEHQLMINRLKYELVIRSVLKEQQEELLQIKTQLIKENVKIEKKVNRFDKLLDDFVDSTIPVEQALEAEEKAILLEAEKEKEEAEAIVEAEKEKAEASDAVEKEKIEADVSTEKEVTETDVTVENKKTDSAEQQITEVVETIIKTTETQENKNVKDTA